MISCNLRMKSYPPKVAPWCWPTALIFRERSLAQFLPALPDGLAITDGKVIRRKQLLRHSVGPGVHAKSSNGVRLRRNGMKRDIVYCNAVVFTRRQK